MGPAFCSFKKGDSERFVGNLIRNRYRLAGVTFVAAWCGRKLCILKIERELLPVTQPSHDIEGLRLRLPIVDDPAYYVRECMKFGSSVASAYRKVRVFERVLGSDGAVHIAHAYHHVCLCGHRGPFDADGDVVFEIDSSARMCSACDEDASKPKSFRARYHPISPATKTAQVVPSQ